MNQPVVAVSVAALGLFVGLAFVLLCMASVYDLLMTRQRSHTLNKTRLHRPQISILVYCDNAAPTIAACLDSISSSKYPHYDIVVINNVSTDATRRTLTAYRAGHRAKKIIFYHMRKKTTKYQALQQGYRRSKRGDLVLVLDGNSELPPNFFKESVGRFTGDKNLRVLKVRAYNDSSQQFAQLVTQFWQLSYSLYQKSVALLPGHRLMVGESGVWYRASTFKKAVSPSYRYDSTIVFRQSTQRLLRPNTHWSIPMACILIVVFLLLLMTYFIVVAMRLETSAMLTLSWLALSIWCGATVLADDVMNIKKKLELFVTLPLIYFFLYVQLIIYIFGFMREFLHTLSRLSIYSKYIG